MANRSLKWIKIFLSDKLHKILPHHLLTGMVTDITQCTTVENNIPELQVIAGQLILSMKQGSYSCKGAEGDDEGATETVAHLWIKLKSLILRGELYVT